MQNIAMTFRKTQQKIIFVKKKHLRNKNKKVEVVFIFKTCLSSRRPDIDFPPRAKTKKNRFGMAFYSRGPEKRKCEKLVS